MTVDDGMALRMENERLQARVAELEKWSSHLEASIDSLANGLANGLREWVEALHAMSPLRGGNGESLVDTD